MTQTIKIKRSAVQGKVPTTSDLQLGELAINTYDGNLYMLKNDGVPSVVNLTSDPAQFVFKTGSTMTGVLTASAGVVGNLTGNVTGAVTGSLSGNASTSTILQTARMINGVPFDGSANITVSDSTRVLKAGDTMTGTLIISGDGQMLRPTATSTAGIPGLRIQDSTNARRVEILALGSAASTTYGVTAGNSVINVASGTLNFSTVDAVRMTIDTVGNVGIGTAPTSRLTVGSVTDTSNDLIVNTSISGISRVLANSSGFGVISITSNNSASADLGIPPGSVGIGTLNSGPFVFTQNSIERMRIDASGNIGIGTTTPGNKLTVIGNISAGNSGVGYDIVDVSSTNGVDVRMQAQGSTNIGSIGTQSNHPFYLYSNNVERVRLDTSGNVGIGGAASVMLHLKGAAATPRVRVESSTNSVISEFLSDGGGALGSIGTVSNHPFTIYTNSTTRLTVDASGNLTVVGDIIGTARVIPGIAYTATIPLTGLPANTYIQLIPNGSMANGSMYTITCRWDHSVSGAPFVVATTFNIFPCNTNGNAADVEFNPPTSTHLGSVNFFTFRTNSATSSGSGLQCKFNWTGDGNIVVNAYRVL